MRGIVKNTFSRGSYDVHCFAAAYNAQKKGRLSQTKAMGIMMNQKLRMLTAQIAEEIRNGIYGPPGEPFVSVRALAAEHHISQESACKLLTALQKQYLIRLCGKHYYLSNGFVPPSSPYGTLLANTRKPLLAYICNRLDSPFFSKLAKLLSSTASAHGYTLLTVSSNQFQHDGALVDEMLSLGVCGIIANPSITPQAHEVYKNCPLPLLTIGRDLSLDNADAVSVDNITAGKQAAEHLIEIGCSEFAYVGLEHFLDADPRLQGFREHLRACGMSLPEDRMIAIDEQRVDIESSHHTLGQFHACLKNLPKGKKLGIFCYHDILAEEVIQKIKQTNHLQNRNYRIPDDIAIIGFDDLPIASSITPKLSTIGYRYDVVAKLAIHIIADYITNPEHVCEKHEVHFNLVIRDSSVSSDRHH